MITHIETMAQTAILMSRPTIEITRLRAGKATFKTKTTLQPHPILINRSIAIRVH
jgi:hypothetical protein